MTGVKKRPAALFIALIGIIILFDLTLARSQLFVEDMELLSIAIALDFVIVIPLLLYFIHVRRQRKNMIAVAPFALLGFLTLLLILPSPAHHLLQLVALVIIPFEIAYVGYIGYKASRIFRSYKANLMQLHYPVAALRKSMTDEIGSNRWTALLIHELTMLYYAFFSWRKKQAVAPHTAAFSYHKESNWLIIVLFACKLLVLEGVLFHIVLAQWSHLVAWLFTIGNVYLILLLIADFRAMVLNPIAVSKHAIKLQYGLQMSCEPKLDNIESISTIKFEKLTNEQLKTSLAPLATEANVLLTLKEPIVATALFGSQKSVRHIYLFLDQPQHFVTECQQHMQVDQR